MELDRTKNAVRNVKFGVLKKAAQIVLPFLIRTVMIHTLGVEFLGLNSLFTSLLRALNLAELGVGSAMVYSMYKPIVEDDTEKICALVRLYRTYYRIIGLVVAVIGIALTPALPYLIQTGTLPGGISLSVLYWMNLFATVLSYWLFSYKNSLLMAFQRTDIMSKIAITAEIIQSLLQLAVLVFLKNYYVFLVVVISTQVVNNVMTAIIVNKNYPQYLPKGKLPGQEVKSINQRIKDLFTTKFGMVITSDVDTLVISAFLGLKMLAIYQNYYCILASVLDVMDVLYAGSLAGIGNSLITEGKEKNYHDLKMMTFIVMWAGGLCACLLLVLYQPFMTLWMGEELLLPIGPVIMLSVYFFVLAVDRMFGMFKDAGGIWHKDRFRPLITAFLNLGMNLILVQFIGIYGILLSTLLSTVVVGIPWLLHNLFYEMFDPKELFSYVGGLIRDIVIVCITVAAVYVCCSYIPLTGFVELCAKAAASLILCNGIFILIWRKRMEFDGCLGIAKNMVRRNG